MEGLLETDERPVVLRRPAWQERQIVERWLIVGFFGAVGIIVTIGLLIASARFSAEDACEVRRLLLMGGSTPFALRERLAGRRQPGTARARQHLDDVERVRLDADEEARLRPLQPPLTR